MLDMFERFLGMTGDTGKSTQEKISDPTTKPLEGKVEAEKHGYASELVAYRVVDNLARIITDRVQGVLEEKKVDARILLVDDLEQAAGGLALVEIKAQTQLVKEVFEGRKKAHEELLEAVEAPTPALPTITMNFLTPAGLAIVAAAGKEVLEQLPKAVGAVVDVLAYFRTNYKVTGRDMSVSKQALLCSTAGHLASSGFTVFIPGFYQVEESPLLGNLTDLARCAARLKTERDSLAQELSEANGSDKQPPAKIANAVRETDAALLIYEGLITAWMATPAPRTQGEEKSVAAPNTTPTPKPADSTEPSKLAQAIIQETIENLRCTHLLSLSHFSSGGESTIRDRLVVADREGFMGGAAVGYVLADREGRILAACTFAQFGIVGGKLKELTEGKNFDEIDYKPDIPGSNF